MNINLAEVQLNWCKDIFKRIQEVLDKKQHDEDKLAQIQWLLKQVRFDRED